jgi:hypothetical protein
VQRGCEILGIEEVKDLRKGLDFRLPQYRREVFLRFYEFHLKYKAHPGCVYFVFPFLAERYGWSMEDKLWFAFINGNTQNPVTSWLIFNSFPNLNLLSIKELEDWYSKEFKRLEFDTDRRHQKSDFVQSVDCYKKLTNGNQVDYFSNLAKSEDEYENFRVLWKVVKEQFYSFGRLATFSYLEYLRIMGVNLDCDQLFLDDLSGSKSHRNGLAKVLGRDDLDWHDSNPSFDGKYSKDMIQWLEKEAELLLLEAKERMRGKPYFKDVSYFTLESAFCTYKSWYRKNRRYPGVYADMFHDRIKRAEKRWPEKDFGVFWEARRKYLPWYLRLEDNPKDLGLKPEKQNHFRNTGQVIMMHHDWECFENDYNKRCGN